MSGLNLPQEVGLGAAVLVNPNLLIATEVKWIDWSSALTTSTLSATNPDNASAPSVQQLTSNMYWRDQFVLAIGIAYNVTNNSIFRAGYNFGRNPVPKANLNPLLPAISQHTLTVGAGYHLNEKWQVDGGLEYILKEAVRYTNVSSPFGPDAQEVNEVLALHLRLTYWL